MTFGVLLATWEVVLRYRGGATIDVTVKTNPDLSAVHKGGEQWVIFGNCLVMTGVSPKRLKEQLGENGERVVTNIAAHEESPIAFFEYLRRSSHYPDVIVANVSSWLNGTNFEQESELVAKTDPLSLTQKAGATSDAASSANDGQRAYTTGDLGSGRFQRSAEATLGTWGGTSVRSFGHRYHLFDYLQFLKTLVTTADLDNSLYQLGMQSWFRVTASETDGLGYLGLQIAYRNDWEHGVDVMAERSLQRLRLSRLLNARYWALLEEHVRDFKSHGTQVLLVRMPEHPKIRAFNDETYEISEKMRGIGERTGAPVLDLSRLGPAEGVHLFDAVHPDAASAEVITREIGTWLRARVLTERSTRPERAGGG